MLFPEPRQQVGFKEGKYQFGVNFDLNERTTGIAYHLMVQMLQMAMAETRQATGTG